MSFISKLFKPITKVTDKIVNHISGGFGGWLNDVTGATDSARQQRDTNIMLQKMAQDFNAAEAEKTRDFNAEQAQMERDWQTEMSNTARQRAAADLKSAGINPVLAAGAGADTGAGAAASGGQATSPGGGVGAGASSANPISMITELVNAKNNTARTEADVQKINAETVKTLTEAGYTEEKIKNATHERDLIIQSIKTAKSEEDKKKAETKLIKWNEEHALLIQIMPAIAGIAGGIIGGALGQPLGGAVGGILSARKNQIGFQH